LNENGFDVFGAPVAAGVDDAVGAALPVCAPVNPKLNFCADAAFIFDDAAAGVLAGTP